MSDNIFHGEELSIGQRFFKATMPIWLGVLTVLVVTGMTYSGWQRVRHRVVLSAEYRFSDSAVHVTETPPWVPETIVNDVVSNFNIGRPAQETLINQELLKELTAAFRDYPWVESVDRIRATFPATITIDLTYREPVCMVVLPNMAGVYAVDKHGVHLPSDYFKNHAVDVDRYIKILNVDSMPEGNIGSKWGDPTVEQAAALADHLNRDNTLFRIVSIRGENTGTHRRNMRTVFYLQTSQGLQIRWGEMPLAENDTRKERLLERVRQYGTLEKSPTDADGLIDLTRLSF